MKRTLLWLGIFLWILTSCKTSGDTSSTQEEGGFSFAFLTDIHVQPERNAEEGFMMAINEVNKQNPDFVITGGDLVMDVLNQSYERADSLFNIYIELSKKFKMPVYNSVGNHEVYAWYRQDPGIEQDPEYGKLMFEKRLGDRFYSFNHKGWHFIVLDAISRAEGGGYQGMIDEEQIHWLAKDLLEVNKETPIAISVHIPFITSVTQLMQGSMAPNTPGQVISNGQEVLALFSEYNLRLVLQGHLHFLEDIYVQNQVHFITGGAVSGKWWANKPDSKPEEGFVMVHVNGEDLDWEYVDYGWTPATEN